MSLLVHLWPSKTGAARPYTLPHVDYDLREDEWETMRALGCVQSHGYVWIRPKDSQIQYRLSVSLMQNTDFKLTRGYESVLKQPLFTQGITFTPGSRSLELGRGVVRRERLVLSEIKTPDRNWQIVWLYGPAKPTLPWLGPEYDNSHFIISFSSTALNDLCSDASVIYFNYFHIHM